MGYDPEDDDEKTTLAGDLKYIITRGASAEHAPLMHAILDDLIYTLFDANENPSIPSHKKATFMDMHDFLEDEERQTFLLSFVRNKRLKRKWEQTMPSPKERTPVISRMTKFVNSRPLSAIFGTPDPKLNIAEFMNNRKIILVDLGGISETKQMYGALLIAKIQQAAFGRHNIPKEKRVPFYLFVDEFEHFQTSSFEQIISQARGYQLCLTVGNQWLDQLDTKVESALFTVSSYILFALSEQDSKKFKALIRPFETDDLVSLPQFHALYLIDKKNPRIRRVPERPPHTEAVGQKSYADYIRKRTDDLYGCKTIWKSHTEGNEPDKAPVQNKAAVAESSDSNRKQPKNIPVNRSKKRRD